jgi:hypothetical protein
MYLHPIEVDLLCSFADVAAPFPLEVPSTGTTEAERLVMYAGARETLTERDLADEDGPLGVADDFVYLLRNATGVLDLVLAQEKLSVAAVVLTYRDEALLVVQDLADPDLMIQMKALTLDDAVEELMHLVPALEASLTAPFNLPRQAVQNAFQVLLDRLPEVETEEALGAVKPLPTEEVEELLGTHGIDERVTRRMVAHLQPVLGNGQAGVAKRDDSEDQWHRVGTELRWVDTSRGRLRLAEDGEWISVNPLTADEIRAALRRLAGTIRG